jgi:hypothetical protein
MRVKLRTRQDGKVTKQHPIQDRDIKYMVGNEEYFHLTTIRRRKVR